MAVASHTPMIVQMDATMPISARTVKIKARITIAMGAQRSGITPPPTLPLLNIGPKISFALGKIPLTTIPIPVPTMRPIPNEDLMLAAVAASQIPATCPPMRIPKSPMIAPRNHTPINTGPMIYPTAISINESHMPPREP